MRTTKYIFLLVFLLSSTFAHADSKYDKLWKAIEQAQRDDRPRLILELSRELYTLADKEDNVAQQGRALAVQLNTYSKLPEDGSDLVSDQLEHWQESATDYKEKAIVHTLQCALLSPRQFDEIIKHAHYIYEYGENLHKISSRSYVPFVRLGTDSQVFKHRLYPLLSEFVLQCLQRSAGSYYCPEEEKDKLLKMQSMLYKQWLSIEQSHHELDAALLVAIGMVEHLSDAQDRFSGFNALITTYSKCSTLLELYIVRAVEARRMGYLNLALQIANEGIKRYPKVPRARVLQRLIYQINRPYLRTFMHKQYCSTDSIMIQIYSENTPKLAVKIGHITHVVSLYADTMHIAKDTTLYFPPLPYGKYCVDVQPITNYPDSLIKARKTTDNTFAVSDLTALVTEINPSNFYVLAINKLTGQIVPGALVTLKGDTSSRCMEADKHGVAVFSNCSYLSPKVSVRLPKDQSDQFMPFRSARFYRLSCPENKIDTLVQMSTDRPIYHSGDSVHVRVLAYTRNDVHGRVLPNKKMTFTLKNPSRKKVQTYSVVTDKHGVGTIHITLPKHGLNGTYTLRSNNWYVRSKSIEVADYQLPSFTVKPVQKYKDSLQVGQPFSCILEAMQMTGVPMQHARVNYSIKRVELFGIYSSAFYNSIHKDILHGKGVTNEKGRFLMTITLDSLQVLFPKERFEVSYHVVAPSGESHDATQTLMVYGGKHIYQPQLPDSITNPIWTANKTYTYGPKSPANFTIRVNRPNRQLYMIYATSDKVYVEALKRNKMVSDSTYTVKTPYMPAMRHGVYAHLYAIGDRQIDAIRVRLELCQPDKQLHIQTVSFRDHLIPKSVEAWKFRVLDTTNKPVKATLGVWMYDAALDALAHSGENWQLSWQPNLINSGIGELALGWCDPDSYSYRLPKYPSLALQKDAFMGNWWYSPIRIRGRSVLRRAYTKQSPMANYVSDKRLGEQKMDISFVPSSEDRTNKISNHLDFLRVASTPTAYFYPNLQTDKLGTVQVVFKTPVDLTTWRVHVLAHTDSLDQGQIDTLVVTNKPLMVHPVLPRFCRVGDQCTLSTQVSNRQNISNHVSLDWVLFDLDTKKILEKHSQNFVLKANAQKTLKWTPKIFSHPGQVGFRVIAQSHYAQDGEQHVLRILDNQVQVKTSLPFTLSPASQVGSTWSSNMQLFEQADSIHVELTHGLYSVALQQLPSLFVKGNPYCVYGTMHRYYATLLGQMILNKQPALKAWLNDQIKSQHMQTHNASSWVDTPWEALQEARRTLWLNLASADTILDIKKKEYVKGLKALQTHEGSFSWFPGMHGSRFLTSYILELHAYMSMLLPNGTVDGEVNQSMAKAYAWTQRNAHHCMLMKQQKKECVEYFDPYTYLYVWALYTDGKNIPQEVHYFYNQLPKESCDIPVSRKLQVALAALKMGEVERAKTLMHSLSEYALYSDHTKLLSSAVYMTNLLGHTKGRDEVIMHALQKARTKAWGAIGDQTRIIYSLLAMDTQVPSTFSAQLTLESSIDKKDISNKLQKDWKNVVTGLVTEDVLTPRGTFTHASIKNESTVPLWGVISSVHTQKNTQLSAVSSSGLSIKRILLKEIREGNRIVWSPSTAFHKGDVVRVQIIITAPQSMSLIQITDRYAGALVPRDQLARFNWGYPSFYLDPKQTEMQCFIHQIPKGETLISYDMLAQQSGEYTDNGVELISCYAPEYTANSDSKEITIE